MPNDRTATHTLAVLTFSLLSAIVLAAGCATHDRAAGITRQQEDTIPDPGDPPPPRPAPAPAPPPLPTTPGCNSIVDASGLLCTTCNDNAAECLPAQCSVVNHCLRCTDPEGRTGEDCSIDYDLAPAASFGIAPGDTSNMASCTFVWGLGNATGTTCHYPGTSSCVVSSKDDWQCLTCSYPDGSGSGLCTGEDLPDPLAGLPDDLPAPGTCVNEVGADGQVVCTTCSRDDLSATRSCHYPGVASCSTFDPRDWAVGCLGRCRLEDGTIERLCNSPSGPKLVPLPAP